MFQNGRMGEKLVGESLDRQSIYYLIEGTLPKLERGFRYNDEMKRKEGNLYYQKRRNINLQEKKIKNINLSYVLKQNLQSNREDVKEYLRRVKKEENSLVGCKIRGLPLLKR